MITSVLSFAGTILLFNGMKRVHKLLPTPLLLPIVTSTAILIMVLLLTGTAYEAYMEGGEFISMLLGPAVVALAFPLHDQWDRLKKHILLLAGASLAGTLIGLFSGMYMAILFGMDSEIIRSLIPKSVTAPIAMDIASMIHGIPALAAVYVMVAGISGSMFGPFLMRKLLIQNPIAVGIGYGAASHGVGTARALEYGEQEGAVSSAAMTFSAIFASLLCPHIAALLL
ncbi:LrgB family protein [Metabacillus sp. KIGAM252]|uniref:LrgB family protein n=1 Tax=Metabacillus flavus TaxID=2823519 RepID=A0ABS5LH40_9BACI|nr:LrgB family protein [Metabacillus flavus]MBS2970070.1 LrgB family protein [Metabacillus flavus]